jgi:5,10-methylenetetrahydromethanopterin reductase
MVELWRMGPTPLPATGIGRFAKSLEASGWDGLAFGENNKQPDPFVMLALAAAATTTLRLGTATLVPIRHPLLMAVSMTTIAAVSGGRARFSIGRGDSAVKALQQKPMSIERYEEYLDRLQRYLRRETVEIDGDSSTIGDLAVVDPSLDVPKPPVDAAATGPKMIELAVRFLDSVSFAVGADPVRLQRCIDLVHEVSERIGRVSDPIGLGCYVQMAVAADADIELARERIRPLAMTFARFSAYEGKALADVDAADQVQIQRAAEALDAKFRASGGRMKARPGGLPGELDTFRDPGAVDDAFIDRFAIIGPPEHCAERLQSLVDLGLSRIYIGTRFMGTDVGEENTARIARHVIPLVRRATVTAA